MNLQSSTLKFDESGKPFHIQQAEQIRLYKEAWKKAGHKREARVSVSRSIFALVNDQDRAYFGQGKSSDSFGYIEPEKRAVFGKSYAAEPDQLIKELAQDEAIQEADTLLLTIPNTLGVDYNIHILSAILEQVAPGIQNLPLPIGYQANELAGLIITYLRDNLEGDFIYVRERKEQGRELSVNLKGLTD